MIALLFTILTGMLPGCLRYTQNRSKRSWLHIVVGDVSLVATAVATALASDDGLVTMWFAIVANALSAVGSHLVFVFWDEGREMRREKRSMADENGEAPETNRRALKVALLGVGILASSHSIGLGRVDDNDARLLSDWTSFVVIQLLAILAHIR